MGETYSFRPGDFFPYFGKWFYEDRNAELIEQAENHYALRDESLRRKTEKFENRLSFIEIYNAALALYGAYKGIETLANN